MTTYTESDGDYEVYWPRGPRQTRIKPLAKRLDTLAGKRIAFLWDYLFRGNEIYDTLSGEMRKRFPGVNFVDWKAFGNIHGTDERKVVAALPEKFRELGVDAAISGLGC
jgi:hypothetical protein